MSTTTKLGEKAVLWPMKHLQLSEGVLDVVVAHASNQVQVKEVVKVAGAALLEPAVTLSWSCQYPSAQTH